jgi:hypothetical protein
VFLEKELHVKCPVKDVRPEEELSDEERQEKPQSVEQEVKFSEELVKK